MSLVEKLALGLVIVFLVVAALRLFSAPLKIVVHLAVNALLGFCALWLLNVTASVSGISLGLNLFNAILIGILGLPGLGLLLLLQWVLT